MVVVEVWVPSGNEKDGGRVVNAFTAFRIEPSILRRDAYLVVSFSSISLAFLRCSATIFSVPST